MPDYIAITCVDGMTVVENPESPTRNYSGDGWRLQLGRPLRWAKLVDGERLTLLAASAEAENRLVSFRADADDEQDAPGDEQSLDELLEEAHDELDRAGRA
jgi:hypothetical protein